MLVVTRKTGQKIMVGDDIEITLVEAERGRAKIGVQAPRQLPVHRLEIWLQRMGLRRRPCGAG